MQLVEVCTGGGGGLSCQPFRPHWLVCGVVTDFSARYKCRHCIGFRENWKLQFSPRNLVALSAQPVVVEPTHYTGQPGYVTDTEDSPSIDDDVVKKFKGDTGEMAAAKPGISVRNTELWNSLLILSSSAGLQPVEFVVLAMDVSVFLSVCHQTFFKSLSPPTVFVRVSWNLAQMIYVPTCKKSRGTDFPNFDFKSFGNFLKFGLSIRTAAAELSLVFIHSVFSFILKYV